MSDNSGEITKEELFMTQTDNDDLDSEQTLLIMWKVPSVESSRSDCDSIWAARN